MQALNWPPLWAIVPASLKFGFEERLEAAPDTGKSPFQQMNHRRFKRFVLFGSFFFLLLFLLPSAALPDESPKEQMEFGVKAAKRGLWREALFRWEKALKLDPRNPRLMNNLAVAYETAGEFKKADEMYQQALSLEPGNRDIKQNHDLFVSYYKQMQHRREENPAPPPPPPAESQEPPPPSSDDAPPPR